MAQQAETFCIRCGKQRVYSRQWKEKDKGKGTVITHMESVCPDTECQKIVDEQFAQMRERRENMENKRKSIVVPRKAKTP